MSKHWSLVEFRGPHPAEKHSDIPSLRKRMWTWDARDKCSIFVSRNKVSDPSWKGRRIFPARATDRNTRFPLFLLLVEPAKRESNTTFIKIQENSLPFCIWTNGKVSSSLNSDMKHGNVTKCNKQCLSYGNSEEMLGFIKSLLAAKQ